MTTVPREVRLAEPGQLTAPARTGALRRGRRIRLNGGFAAMSLVTIVVAFLVLFPLAMLVFGSFWTARPGFPGTFTLDNYIKAYTDADTYRIFLTTVLLVGAKTLVAVTFAATLAWIVTRTDTPFRGTLEILLTVPFFIPGLLEAIGWIMLLSPNTGTINVWLKALLGLQNAPLNIYSLGGMIWVMSLGSTSFIFLLLVNALRNMDASLEESARASGAGPVRTALTVTLPLVAPVILGAGMLSFIRAMDSFEVPVLLGMPAKVFVFSNRIYAAIQYDYPVNYGLATALGVSFFALIGLLIYVQSRILHGKQFFVVTGKGYQPHRAPGQPPLRDARRVFAVLRDRDRAAAVAGVCRVVPARVRSAALGSLHPGQLRRNSRRCHAVAGSGEHVCGLRRGGAGDGAAVHDDRLHHDADDVCGPQNAERD
jgi:iron(III) transport system permease protein